MQYTKPVRDDDSDDDLDCIYKITTQGEDWVNLTADEIISWEHESSCTSDSDEEIERLQNRLHEVTTLNCNMMIRSLHCMTTEARELPTYDGLSAVDEFLSKFDALKWALHAKPAQWWGMH